MGYKTKEGQDLYSELLAAGGDAGVITSIHAARLTNMLSGEVTDRSWEAVVEQAELVAMSVDQPALLAWLGMKADLRDNAGEVKKEMEKSKGQLIEALSARGEGFLELGEQDNEKLLQVYTDLLKYTEVTDTKVFSFMWKLFRNLGLYAKALKLSVKQLEDKPSKDNEAIVQDLSERLGWTHVVRILKYGKPARFPADYQPF